MKISKFGVIGLGKIGENLILNAIDKGYEVAGKNRSQIPENLKVKGFSYLKDTKELVKTLPEKRVIFLYIPAGPAVDKVIDELVPLLHKGDILVDGGNSYWGDSLRRAQRLQEEGIHYMDCGTSGGIPGARNGACFMFGGNKEAANTLMPLLEDLAVEGGVVYTGPSGSGHFVKLVHNGIEFGMLQAIGEGMNLLTHYRENLDIEAILKTWNSGSVIRSWLVELMGQQYKEQQGLENINSYIEDTGEVNWLITDAMKMEVPVPVTAQSVMQLFTSRQKNADWAKAIAMMRHGFGEHPFGKDESIQKERRTGRVGQFPEEEEDN